MLSQREIVMAFSKILKKKGTIVEAAKLLGISIAETSKIVDSFSKDDLELEKLFKSRGWPRNVLSGYVYLGVESQIHRPHGEQLGLLKPGMHVFAEKISKRVKSAGVHYYFIYLSSPLVERKYLKYQLTKVEDGKRYGVLSQVLDDKEYVWLIENGQELYELIDELAKYNVVLEKTKSTRIKYVRGIWAGEVDSRSIVSVNYDWK